jgi:hypothetical protein
LDLPRSLSNPLIPNLPFFFFFLKLTDPAVAARGVDKLSNAKQSTAERTRRLSNSDSKHDNTGNILRGLEEHPLKTTALASTPKKERRTSMKDLLETNPRKRSIQDRPRQRRSPMLRRTEQL